MTVGWLNAGNCFIWNFVQEVGYPNAQGAVVVFGINTAVLSSHLHDENKKIKAEFAGCALLRDLELKFQGRKLKNV